MRLNDHEREMWTLNSESLYRAWKRSHLPMRRFIRENRAVLDSCIFSELNKGPRR